MKNSILLLITVSALSLFSCEKKKPLNVVCGVDFSKTIDSATINWYESTISQSVIRKEGAKDAVTILPIDFGSQTSSQELFRADFSYNNYENEFAGLQAEEVEANNHRDSVNAAIRRFQGAFKTFRVRRSAFDKGTDIFGALKQAEKYFDPNKENIIVIFSDMLQYTDAKTMNFEDHLTSESEIEALVQRADKADLHQAQVIVLTGVQPNIRPEKFNVVKAFWEQYFKACNATLLDYSSGAVTKLEELFRKGKINSM